MNFEYEDYRKRPEPENIGTWPTYYVPDRFIKGYLFKLFLFFYLIPVYFFGIWLFADLTTFFLYFIMYDIIEYYSIKNRIQNGQ
jgi:hypothetical protein